MVFVPWSELGICKFWALHQTTCDHGDRCKWRHPPQEEIDRIWNEYTVADHFEWGRAAPPGNAVRAAPPPNHPVSRMDGSSDEYSFRGASGQQIGGYQPMRAPRSAQPQPPPRHSTAYDAPRPLTHGNFYPSPYQSSRPPSSSGFDGLPRPSSSGSFSLDDSSASLQPHPSHFATPLALTDMSRRPAPEIDPSTGQPLGLRFDPARSHNPYVNGSCLYRFVWGEPLCVRCGTTGHLPKQCRGPELFEAEQDYLYRIMRAEQNRSKAQRGLDSRQPIRELAPTSDAEMRLREGSILDAPQSPRGTPQVHDRACLPAQSSYWSNYKAKQQLSKQRSLMRDDGEIMDLNTKSAEQYSKVRTSAASKSVAPTQEGATAAMEAWKKKHKLQPKSHEVGIGIGMEAELRKPAAKERSTTAAPAPPGTALVPSPYSSTLEMGATKRMSNGEAKAVGPHPSTIRVSASYITQSAIEKRLQPSSLEAQERSLAEAREDNVRLQGVTWLDNVRRALQLPVRTFTTAVVYYHKFRLAHPAVEYSWSDAAAASLLTSCKNEDTLKKSRDILAAAYNLKQPATHEPLGSDDPIFEAPSRVVIGLERLVLESGGFDFRSRGPHHVLVKISKSLPKSEDLKSVSQLAWTVLTDLHRTFSPLKQTSATLALASLELAAHFTAAVSDNNTCTVRDDLQALNLKRWHTTREEVMETLLDALDLYMHHTPLTILGSKYTLDDFLRIRLALNKECSESSLPRYTIVQPPPSPDNANGTGSTLRVANGHPTPVSPPQPGTQAPQQPNGSSQNQPIPEGGATLRFMLDPQRATDERADVNRYYVEEWEEYEEEIEVPLPRARSRDSQRGSQRARSRDFPPDRPGRERDGRSREFEDRRGPRDDRDGARPPPAGRERGREREAERERARLRDRERERRYDDRRYDDRERGDRRYDDRRGDRDRDRRFYDDDRRRGREDRR